MDGIVDLKIKEGTPGSLKYYKKKENWLFKDRKAYYEYTATGTETLFQIKQKFGIKDKGLYNCNHYYKDDSHQPLSGTIIRFYEEDIM